MSDILLGLNFGSTNVVIAKKNAGLVLRESNLIAANKDDNKNLVITGIGNEVDGVLGKTDSNKVIFSPVSYGEIVSTDYASAVLKSFLTKLNIRPSIFNALKIVSTIPVGLNSEQKQKYVDMCLTAKAKDVVLIPRIFCCALGENINISANNAHMIVDIGGGTVDCAVINMNTIITGATLCIGGRSMDSSIVSFIKFKYGATIGLKTATYLKENIGSLYENDMAQYEVSAIDDNTGSPVQVVVTAKDIFEATSAYLDEIVKIIKTIINTLSPEISNDVVRNGITICGGYSKVTGLKKYLRNKLGFLINISDESNNAAANGLVKLINSSDLIEELIKNL